MAKGIIVSGGNGGDTSDDCTVTADKVVAGQTYIGADTNDDIGSGTLPDRASYTNASSTAMSNSNIYIRIPKGAYRAVTSAGLPEIVLPTNMIGCTAAKIIAGQSIGGIAGTATNDATATDPYVYSGRTYYSKGAKRTGTMTVSSVVSFNVAAYSTKQLLCTWKNPAKGPYSGVIIRYKTGSYPSSVTDGTLGYQGGGTNHALNATNSAIVSGLSSGTQYYVRIWMYCNTSVGVLYSGYASSSGAIKTTNGGRQVFTGSGTFVVPAGVRELNVCVVGAGGSTYTRSSKHQDAITKGASGGYVENRTIAVEPGQQFPIVVGAPARIGQLSFGGDGTTLSHGYWYIDLHPSKGNPPNSTLADFQKYGQWRTYTTKALYKSGASSFGSITAQGGTGHHDIAAGTGLPGGSGSGAIAGHIVGNSSGGSHGAGGPGSNGGNGGDARGTWYSHDSNDRNATYHFGGIGQGKSTREFGTGTLYATAGAAGIRRTKPTPGADNTGNGASGGGGYLTYGSALGGSGVVVVSW